MPTKKKKGGFWRGLFLFLLGFSAGLGAAASLAVYINELPLPFIAPPTRQATAPGEAGRRQEERDIVEFHNLLRQSPPQAQPQQPQQLEEEDAAAVTRRFVYYLQIGAFRDVNRAEELRGRLTLQDRDALIRDATLADGNTLYRVWMGPYGEENDAESVRAELALEGYDNIRLLRTTE